MNIIVESKGHMGGAVMNGDLPNGHGGVATSLRGCKYWLAVLGAGGGWGGARPLMLFRLPLLNRRLLTHMRVLAEQVRLIRQESSST